MTRHRAATDRRSPLSSQLALNRGQAAEALGMSLSHFKRHVAPEVRCVYSGSLRLYPVADLQAWLDRQSCTGGKAA